MSESRESAEKQAVQADDSPLFRREALDAAQSHWMGSVLLEPKLSHAFVTLGAVLAASAVIALLIFGSFARKARVEGVLVPEQGLVRMYTPQAGVVTRLHVAEGREVKKGEPVIAISGDVQSEALGATAEEVIARLKLRRKSTEDSGGTQDRILQQRAATLQNQLQDQASQQHHLAEQIELQRARVAVTVSSLQRERGLRKAKLTTLTRLQDIEQNHLEQKGDLQELERLLANLKSEITAIAGELEQIPMLREQALAETARSASTLDQQLAEAEARRQLVIAAPQDGVVTALLTEPGGNVFPTAPLLSIIPKGSKLQAHLYGPSRAIGFVREGQRVQLRFQPFPYQKFGSYAGSVTSISRSPVSPSELPRQFSRTQTSNDGEPVYRITVRLDRQDVLAYGQAVPLQAGMQVEADVIVETRSLLEWLFDPLYALSGKING